MPKEIVNYLIIGIIVGLIFFEVGFYISEFKTLNWCVDMGTKIIKFDGVDSRLVAFGLMRYEQKAKSFFLNYNASILNDTGN